MTPVDERLLWEANHFTLRFACEDCAHASTEGELCCSLGYPAAPRRESLHEKRLEFCKTFEIG